MALVNVGRVLALVLTIAVGLAGCGGGGGEAASSSSASSAKPEETATEKSSGSGAVEGVKVTVLRNSGRGDEPVVAAERASDARIPPASGYFQRTVPVAGVPGGQVQVIAGTDPTPADIETSTNYSTVNLSVATSFPTTLQADLYEGTALQDVYLAGTATGDLSVLNGRVLHVVVVDPDGLFQDNPEAWINTTPTPGVFVWLHGRPLSTPGSYRGTLKVYACLDSACTVRLGNTPIRIPYEVRVRKGLSIETSKVTLNAVFGVPAATAKIHVTPSEGRSIDEIVIYGSGENIVAAFSPVEPDGSAILNVDGLVSKPGTYTRRITLGTRGLFPHPIDLAKAIDITYTVAPDPNRSYAFDPPSLDVTFKAGDTRSQSRTSYAYLMQGEMSFEAVEFLATPAQLAVVPANLQGHWVSVRTWGQYNAYLQPDGRLTNDVSWMTCDPVTRQCMPPDTYPYRLRLKYVLNGTTTTVYQYGQVQITP